MDRLPTLSWHKLSETASKTDLGGDLPEVVVAKLSNEEFEKIQASEKAAMEFFEKRQYFKKKPNKIKFCETVPGKGAEWFVIFTHTTNSTVVAAASQH
ncbi:MAG TPA: hypothetical protein VMJ93_16320 [Verrucomicrobiae bacterium]|nr:hypothetical protein [Verrucomicrobiae bacterium]